MKDEIASLVGFLVAPIVPAIAFALTSPGLGGGVQAGLVNLVGLSIIGYMYALMFTGLLAFPLFSFLRKHGKIGIVTSVLGGTFVGALVPFIIRLPPTSPLTEWLYSIAGAFPISCTAGALAGLLFWCVRVALLSRRANGVNT